LEKCDETENNSDRRGVHHHHVVGVDRYLLFDGGSMTQAQQVFEAIMATKGHNQFEMSAKGKYLVPALQLRWVYFQLGWEMKGVTA
jgi:hypothetical protein